MIYVIGSGLSGIAAAIALVKRGYHPTILDVGLTPSSEVLSLKARLASVEPEALETNLWGCMPGLPQIHMVDSSVLPTVPAGPIAFTVMANAHRIASECPIDHVQ